jgi:hypothetical protein
MAAEAGSVGNGRITLKLSGAGAGGAASVVVIGANVSRMRRISSSSVPMGISTSISAQDGASVISALLDVPMFDLEPATVAC